MCSQVNFNNHKVSGVEEEVVFLSFLHIFFLLRLGDLLSLWSKTEILSLFVFVIVVHFEFTIQNIVSQLNNCFAIGIKAFDSSRKTST